MNKEYDVFISYQNEDFTRIESIIKRFKENKIQYFIDRKDIKDLIVNDINYAINNCNYFIAIISKNSINSNWVNLELSAVLKKFTDEGKVANIRIVKLDDVYFDYPILGSHKNIEFYKNSDAGLDELLSFIHDKNTIDFDVSFSEVSKFIKDKYLPNSSITEPLEDEHLNSYSKLFKLISKVKSNREKNGNEHNIFESIYDYLEKGYDKILIQGLPGSGKSFFLSILYYFFKSKDGNKVPFYIDLDAYNEYVDDTHAISELRKDFTRISEICKQFDKKEYLFILDGIDDYLRNSELLNNTIFDIVEELNVKKTVVGLSKIDKFYGAVQKNPRLLNLEEFDYKIEIGNIECKGEIFEEFLSTLIQIEVKQGNFSPEGVKRKCIEFISDIQISSLDFYTIGLIVRKSTRLNFKEIKSLSDLYEQILNQIFDDYQRKFKEKILNAQKASEIAFDIFIRKRELNRTDKIEVIYWKIINQNFSVRDYLIASFIIKKLEQNNLNPKDLSNFQHVYPQEINKFIKSLCQKEERRIYNSIRSIIESNDEFNVITLRTKTHLSYILGRFKNEFVVRNSIDLLKKQLLNIKKVEIEKIIDNSIKDALLLYYRTIYISLIYLGQSEYNDEYLNKIIADKDWNAINRGFHLEYYGDIDFDPTDEESLMAIDIVSKPYPKTHNKLVEKIEAALNKNGQRLYIDVDIFTLCSIYQNRFIDNPDSVDESFRKKYIILIEDTLKKSIIQNENLKKYLRMFLNTLKSEFSSYIQIFNQVYQIKETPRAGWNYKKRRVKNPETVATHIYGTMLIAKFFLPDTLPDKYKNNNEYKGYDKSKIIDILFFHDIAEATTKDIPEPVKTDEHKAREIQVIEETAMLSTFEKFGNLYYIESNWKEQSINATLADEIDKIDNLLQLLRYKFDSKVTNEIPDFEAFLEGLKNRINTTIGKEIRDTIIDGYIKK